MPAIADPLRAASVRIAHRNGTPHPVDECDRCLQGLTNDQEHDLLLDALQALHDIVTRSSNGDPYLADQLDAICDPVLARAYRGGIRLAGED